MSVNRRWLGALGVLALAFGLAAHLGAAPEGGQLKVTIKYKGPGKVEATHQVIIWAFSTPQIDASSQPVATQSVTSDGGSASFTGLPKIVYLAAAFNEKGTYDGTSGPPPSGTPIVIYGDAGVAKAVDSGRARGCGDRHLRRFHPHALVGPVEGIGLGRNRSSSSHALASPTGSLGPGAACPPECAAGRPACTRDRQCAETGPAPALVLPSNHLPGPGRH